MHFEHFYLYEELTQALQQLARQYPDLVRIGAIGRSPQGRELWCAEVAGARRQGIAPEHRPGFYIQGNMHAEELAGSATALYLIEYLTREYQCDPQVTKLLEQNVFYIVPRVAPDGSEAVLKTCQRVRSKVVEPLGSNVLRPQDINGDGQILTMRRQSPDGNYVQSEKDSRIMLPRERDDKGPFYQVMEEGVIHDWDGKAIQQVYTVCDFNRNFPADWTPKPLVQGWGDYPLCEPETRAVAEFIINHRNITRAVDIHTGNPAIFYPHALVPKHAKHQEDARLIAELGQMAEEIIGYRFLSGYTEIHSGEPQQMPGSFKDWIYEHRGIPIILIELGIFYNWHGFSLEQKFASARAQEEYWSELLLQWHDQHPERELFYEWTPFDHPQLGQVELGGWNRRMFRNPPLEEMESICEKVTTFVLRYASYAPQLELELKAVPIGNDLYKVTGLCRNVGKLATNGTQKALETYSLAKLFMTLTGDIELEYVAGEERCVMPHLQPGGGQYGTEWVIRTQAESVTVTVSSERGVFCNAELNLKDWD
jgi:hypothetical protein